VSTDHRPPLTYEQAAEYLNDNARHLRDLVARGELPYVKLGRLVRFLPDHLDEWMREQAERRVSA
jgi:excisionase family DNA binding protein